MNKTIFWLFCMLALIACEEKSQDIHLEGEIDGLEADIIYLYGTDGTYEHIDTIIIKEGRFEHTITVDSAVTEFSALLVFDREVQTPLFLKPQDRIKIKGSSESLNHLIIQGGELNQLYSDFQLSISDLKNPSDSTLQAKSEAFIIKNHSSLVSIYLLNTYFVQVLEPNYKKIESLIDQMTGTLQDHLLISQLKEKINKINGVSVGKPSPYFRLPNAKKEMITRTGQYQNKYLLIHFWASWNEQSKESFTTLRKLNKTYKKSKTVGILGVSFDIDKTDWEAMIKKDTLTWEQVCDFKGLNSDIAQQYAISDLPSNVLIGPDGKIAAWNVTEEKLKELVAKKDAN